MITNPKVLERLFIHISWIFAKYGQDLAIRWSRVGVMVAKWCYIYYICNQKYKRMAQTAFTVRMESDTKKRFDELCKDFGMSANTAFNIFARTVVKQQRIPFDVESEQEVRQKEAARRFGEMVDEIRADAQRRGVTDMPLDEINAIIRETRAQMRKEGKR